MRKRTVFGSQEEAAHLRCSDSQTCALSRCTHGLATGADVLLALDLLILAGGRATLRKVCLRLTASSGEMPLAHSVHSLVKGGTHGGTQQRV